MNATTIETVVKYLEQKLRKGVYGSVLIHFRDGKITGITEKNDYNLDAFRAHVEHPVKRVVVTNKLSKSGDDCQKQSETKQNLSKNDKEPLKSAKNCNKNNSKKE